MTSASRTAITLAAAVLAVCATALPGTASADPDVTPPVVTILGFPSANETAGTFVFGADEAVLSYQCQLDARPPFSCVSPTFVSGLGEGPHTFSVSATDLAGNPGAAALYAWVADFTPPSVPVLTAPASGTWTNVPQPTISGTAEANATVRVYDGTELLGATTVDPLGDWSFMPTVPLPDGSYSIRARARDEAGNESSFTTVRTLYIDTLAPVAPLILAPVNGGQTNGPNLAISGSSEPHATVAIEIDSTAAGSGVANSAGNWSVVPSPTPTDGVHSVTAAATDRAGNSGPASTSVSFELESVPPPAPSLTSPADGSVFDIDELLFVGTAEGSTTIRLYRDGIEFASGESQPDGSWSVTASLPDGTHAITATATDEYGNESDPSNVSTVAIDATPPAPPVVTSPVDDAKLTDPRPAIVGTAEPNSQVEVFVDGASAGLIQADATGDWSLALSADLAQGTSTITAVASDDAGHVSDTSAAVVVAVDSIAPTTSFMSGPSAIWDATTAGFLFGADEAGVTFRCRLDGAPWADCTSPHLLSGLRYGGHLFEVYAIDDFGNTEATVRSWEWRTAQVQPDESTDASCRFRRATVGPAAAISRLRATASAVSRPILSFSANRTGIARVTVVRRGKAIARTDVEIDRGRNVARLKLSKKARRPGSVRVHVSSVSLGAGYFSSSVTAKIDRRGRLLISTKAKPRDASGCSENRAPSPPPKLRIVSVVAVTGGAVRVTIASDQLAVVRARAEDSNAGADSETEVVLPRRRTMLVVPVPLGLADPGTNASIYVVAFNGALSQATVSTRIPGS